MSLQVIDLDGGAAPTTTSTTATCLPEALFLVNRVSVCCSLLSHLDHLLVRLSVLCLALLVLALVASPVGRHVGHQRRHHGRLQEPQRQTKRLFNWRRR